MLCVVLVFLIIPPAVASAKGALKRDSAVVVSMGDSYSSGEGLSDFYGYNPKNMKETVKNHDWLAHRSSKCWAGQLTLTKGGKPLNSYWEKPEDAEKRAENHEFDKGFHWFLVATSGAETKHINGKFNKDYNNSGISGSEKLDPQINILNTLKKNSVNVDYVTMTMGGNDAGFGDAMIASVASTVSGLLFPALDIVAPCALRDYIMIKWQDVDKTICPNLIKAYKDIAKASSKNTQIIIAGYPTLISVTGMFYLLSPEEAIIINTTVHLFNKKIMECVKNSGLKNIHFVSVEEKFLGHEAYSLKPYINGISLAKKDDIKDSGISSYSMHPNKDGQKKYAECVQEKINELENKRTSQAAYIETTKPADEETTKPADEGTTAKPDYEDNISYAIEAYKELVAEKNENRDNPGSEYAIDRYSLEGSENSTLSGFSLIPIDNDDIPELAIWTDTAHVFQVELYTYHDSHVVYLGEYGSYSEFLYEPYKGTFLSWYSGQGYSSFAVYKLEDGAVSKVIYGSDDEYAQIDPADATYYINDSQVSSEVYHSAISDYDFSSSSLYTKREFINYAATIGRES